MIGNLFVTFPEYGGVILDLFESLSFHLTRNRLHVFAPVLLAESAEGLEVSARPFCETLREERFLLSLFFLRDRRRRVGIVFLRFSGRLLILRSFSFLLLLVFLPFVRLASNILVVNFLNSRGVVKLEVVHLLQLGNLRSHWLGWASRLRHGAAIVIRLVVVLLTLAFGRIDPVAADDGLHVNALWQRGDVFVVFVLEFVKRVLGTHRELNGLLRETLHFAIECFGFFFTASHDGVDIFVRDRRRRRVENLLGAKANHRQEFILAEVLLVLLQSSLLNDESIERKFLVRFLDHLLLDATVGAKAEHLYLLLLTDAVRSIHRLKIHLRVPVAVVDDDGVRSGEVNT
mmetsp:Transcript_2587/g.10030  ORF Transcript_2587/g.10030 Transcript_2587/m.10030 type:complete len:345 (+) Transcript_2587:674-1708(+)